MKDAPDVRLEELDFVFPQELIAQHPAEPRDSCRLMHLPASGAPAHLRFTDLVDVLLPGDTLVFNDSRVLPARVQAKKETGGAVELLFLHPRGAAPSSPADVNAPIADNTGASASRPEVWEALARPSHRLRPGMSLFLPGGEMLTLRDLLGEGRWIVESTTVESLVTLMERYGTLPLPPYIHEYPDDPESYQTVYAVRLGSAAAPTAGLHFTPSLLDQLRAGGIGSAYVTLHVGLDTFQPIREDVVEDHQIHRETWAVSAGQLANIRTTRARGGRIVAIGTTATRVLETIAGAGLLAADESRSSTSAGGPAAETSDPGDAAGETEIFITPGYRFRAVDVLLTNFHLPRSSVLALTMAFAGPSRLRAAYEEAIEHSYRFFSFGDAMLIEASSGKADQRHGGRDG